MHCWIRSETTWVSLQQWKVGAYRLDIVAVCDKKAVAIECDGERWHSGEIKIREDMERQTFLERIGWRFIRICGSEYYRDSEKTIDRVISELEKYEINPEAIKAASANEDRNTGLLRRVKNRTTILLYKDSSFSAAAESVYRSRQRHVQRLLCTY